MSQVKQKGKREKIVDIVFISLFALFGVVLIKILITIIAGGIPSLFGYSLLNVKTESMHPNIEKGSVILVKLVDEKGVEKIEEGEVIVYNATINGVNTTITHRLIENHANDGFVITKGDANGFNDDPVSTDRVVAVVIKEVNFLSSFYAFLSNGFSFILIIIVPCLLLIAMQVVTIFKNAKALQQEKQEKELNQKIEDIKKQAVEEFLKQQGDEETAKPSGEENNEE